ncbi:MAG: class I SAM-dependent methyltransferase, partial [Alphaproteobacteria bacterium]|nr:class I SAM-dependent methyltransferase [Alphaproteobacteria bacterium]
MIRQFPHAMLPGARHDERARQDFVCTYKIHVLTGIGPGNRTVFERQAKPAFHKRHGRAPTSRRDIDTA